MDDKKILNITYFETNQNPCGECDFYELDNGCGGMRSALEFYDFPECGDGYYYKFEIKGKE